MNGQVRDRDHRCRGMGLFAEIKPDVCTSEKSGLKEGTFNAFTIKFVKIKRLNFKN